MAPTGPAAPAGPAAPRRRARRWFALLGLVAAAVVAGGLVAKLSVLQSGTTPSPPAATTAAAPARPPPLCELLGRLGAGGGLGSRPADHGFTGAAGAAGRWLPEPAALPSALGAHRFRGGCTRSWSGTAGPVVAALFQFPSRTDARAMRGQLRDALAGRGVRPDRVPRVTGGELYLLEPGGGSGQLVMFVCNDRVLQLHLDAHAATADPLLVRLAQDANRELHERTGCPL